MEKVIDIIKKLIYFIPSVIQYKREAKRLSKVDYFNYNELLKGDYVTPYFFNAVCAYGNYKAIENLIHRKFSFVFDYLEHGISYSTETYTVPALGYADRFCVKNIYTYSKERAKAIEHYLLTKNKKKKVIAVGPYILGANNFYSEEKRQELKKKYGKILLVFPAHSMETLKSNYDIQQLLEEIDRHAKSFDTVFICLHWLDINDKEKRKQYTNGSYTLVCNGKPSDPYFLSRQRDLIELSDMVMTNALGSYIGYSVCLNKPVYFYNQKITLIGNTSRTEKDNETINKFREIFGEYSYKITKEQISMVEKIWGKWDYYTNTNNN